MAQDILPLQQRNTLAEKSELLSTGQFLNWRPMEETFRYKQELKDVALKV